MVPKSSSMNPFYIVSTICSKYLKATHTLKLFFSGCPYEKKNLKYGPLSPQGTLRYRSKNRPWAKAVNEPE